MRIGAVSNLLLPRVNGEGVPYFQGYVAYYDTNRQQIPRAVVVPRW